MIDEVLYSIKKTKENKQKKKPQNLKMLAIQLRKHNNFI